MSATWDQARADALKILGDKGEVPKSPDAIDKAAKNRSKAWDEFHKSQGALEAKLEATENANDAARNALKLFLAKIEKSDFNLNSKDKDDLKKIQQARKLLTDLLDTAIKAREDEDKMLDELGKHLNQLYSYQPKPGP